LDNKKRIVIVGATSAIASHCARIWATGSEIDLTLIGRDAGRLERIAADLRVRSANSYIRVLTAEFLEPAGIEAAVDAVVQQGAPDLVLIAHGMLPNQMDCERNLVACRAALDINAISPVLFAEAFARHFAARGIGTLAIIGSVAGDRGRKSNYVYGAAKALVDRYAQGLQHRFAGTAIKIVLIKPGPTATPMTAHMPNAKMASVESVAQGIVAGIDANKATIYVPGKWRVIMLIIRHLPAFVFNKMNI
jgi:decaprenylphospho-beta-D-erythro-pentofuranosid-2-ulose 2-reductase